MTKTQGPHPTPRTDAVLNTFNGVASKLAADLATHAETLELELAASFKGTELIARMLADERGLSGRLAAACQWAQSELGNHTRPSPIDKALAEWKEAFRE